MKLLEEINVNCHLPVLVLHTDKHRYPSDRFSHEFLRFLHYHSPMPDIMQLLAKYQPKAIVSIGSTVPQIVIPYEFRKRWLHFQSAYDFNMNTLENCIFVSHYRHPCILDNPLITVITPAYESKHRILRPLESLQRQTFTNWEWIIIDDSKTENTWATLTEFAAKDPRIQIYRRQHNDGSIGKNKMLCANAGRGSFVFELDHDDDILPHTFDRLLNAANRNTDCDFFYSDFIECGEDNLSPFTYGDDFGFGFGSYWRAWYKNCFHYMCRTPRINPQTLRHIIGVPNHLRCWTKRAYLDVGGYNPELPVADDYDLIVRTMLKYRWCHIPEVLYIQYRNSGGDNFTNHRNALIQYLVSKIRATYENEIKQRFADLGVADIIHPYARDYERNTYVYPILERLYVFDDEPDNPLVTVIVPTYNRPEHLRRALDSIFGQTYTNFEVIVVGDCCPDLDEFVLSYPNAKDRRFKYYNLSKNYGAGGAVPRNYALKMLCATKWVAYLDDDNEWTDNHLASLVAILQANPEVQYVFSSMMIDGAELVFDVPRKGRIDTSCVVHRHELVVKYGLWKDRVEGGYAHDWEFFSRWVGEPYIASKQATLLYNTEFNGQTYDSLLQM
jgi:glycosyltransferase involved in cell wall biosynthesis